MRSRVSGVGWSGVGGGAAGGLGEVGHAELDGVGAAVGDLVHLGEFGPGAGEADLEAFGFAEPAVGFGFGDAVDEVVADLFEAGSGCGIGPQQRAAQTAVFVDAGGVVGRPQSPTATLRCSKWPMNSAHSASVGVRYSLLGRSARRRAMYARWPLITSSG